MKLLILGIAIVLLGAGCTRTCLRSHQEPRHTDMHVEMRPTYSMGFDGKSHMVLVPFPVAARDYAVTVCDEYAKDE